jgi:prepilin-type N-terminal cleavage/methylation domain-containing protein
MALSVIWADGKMKYAKGFSLIEILITMSVFAILIGIVTLNLTSAQSQASLTTITETLVADLSQQQVKAMVGDTEGRSVVDDYGIRISSNQYTLFHGTYSAGEVSNFSIDLPAVFQASTTFPSSQVVFVKGSGEIANFNASQNTITIRDTSKGTQRVIRINRYGVISSIQ